MTVFEFCKALRRRIWSDSEILLLVRPAGKPLDDTRRKPCPGEIRAVTEKDLPDCAAFEDAARYVPVYREMLRRGDVVHFGYLNGRCVFRHCMQMSGEITFSSCGIRRLGPHEGYVHYGFCAPQARGNGFHAESLYRFCHWEADFTVFAIVRENNSSSLKGCFRSGYEVRSLLTVKNRFFRRTLTEKVLSPEEARRYET